MKTVKEQIAHDVFRTAWGWVGVAYSARGVRSVVLPQSDRSAAEGQLRTGGSAGRRRPWPAFRSAVAAYLSGKGPAPSFPLDLLPAGAFVRAVRETACALPPGETVTYGELARRAGRAGAARAVGQVMARNPVPLLVPCHRVVAAGGGLGGFGGGVEMKRRLLDLERHGWNPRPPRGERVG